MRLIRSGRKGKYVGYTQTNNTLQINKTTQTSLNEAAGFSDVRGFDTGGQT